MNKRTTPLTILAAAIALLGAALTPLQVRAQSSVSRGVNLLEGSSLRDRHLSGTVRLPSGSSGSSSGRSSGRTVAPRPPRTPSGSVRRPVRRPAPRPVRVTPASRTIEQIYNQDRSHRATLTNERVHAIDRAIRNLMQRRRHAMYRYVHGGRYAKDLQEYYRLSNDVRRMQTARFVTIRNYHVQTIRNLQTVMQKTKVPGNRTAAYNLIRQQQALLQAANVYYHKTWLVDRPAQGN